MGYLNLSGGKLQSFSKATLSFWFRVPQASIDACNAAYKGDNSPFDGVIPLVTMGPEGAQQAPYRFIYTSKPIWTGTIHYVTGLGNINSGDVTISGGGGVYPWVTQRTFQYNPNAAWQTEAVPEQNITHEEVMTSATVNPNNPAEPTFIGVDPWGHFLIHLEFAQKAIIVGLDMELTGVSPGSYEQDAIVTYGGISPPPTGSGNDAYPIGTVVSQTTYHGPLDYYGTTVTISDTSTWYQYPIKGSGPPYNHTVYHSFPTYAYTDYSSSAVNGTESISCQPNFAFVADQWHHMLLSVDLRTIASHGIAYGDSTSDPWVQYYDGLSYIYLAFDDVNYNGGDLGGYWPQGADPNGNSTSNADAVAGDSPYSHGEYGDDGAGNAVYIGGYVGPIPTFTLADPKIKAGAADMGMPAAAKYVDNIFRVEMAEFQMWIGDSVNTGDEAIRRAFVTADGTPEKMDKAAKLMGRKPDLCLHGSGNWIKGKNTGGEDSPEPPKFDPTGDIKAWKPDPSLHGPQSPASPPAARRARRRLREPA